MSDHPSALQAERGKPQPVEELTLVPAPSEGYSALRSRRAQLQLLGGLFVCALHAKPARNVCNVWKSGRETDGKSDRKIIDSKDDGMAHFSV